MPRQLFISTRQAGSGNFHYYHLPKGLLNLSLQQLDAEGSLSISFRRLIMPDPDHRYFLKYTNTGRSNDKVTIEFNEEGYLKLVNIESEDVTLQVVENVIESIKEAVAPSADRSIKEGGYPAELLNVTIDPFSQEEIDKVSETIRSVAPAFKMRFRSMSTRKSQSLGDGDQPGILCRPMELCELRYNLEEGTEKQELMQMPHPDLVHLISVPNAPLVKSVLNIEFGPYGYPTKINMDQPSWLVPLSKFPGKLIKGIFDLPAQIIQLRVNYLNDKGQSLTELEAAKKRIEALEKAAEEKKEE
jgi:hypothetical protein